MPNRRLTRRIVVDIPLHERGQAIYRDTMLPSFGVRVGAKSKTYIVEGQVNRRTRRVTIGRADLFPPEIVRRKALVVLGDTGSLPVSPEVEAELIEACQEVQELRADLLRVLGKMPRSEP